MGAVYNIKCPRCGWAHSFCLGAGICDERRANEALLALETGPDAARTAAATAPISPSGCARGLSAANECLHVTIDATSAGG